MAELKKCPFCGGEANVITYTGSEKIVYMQCNGCKVLMGFPRIVISARKGKLYFESEAELIEAWNNRVTEADIRAKAIDEFAERLCVELSEKAGVIKVHGVDFDILTVDGATEILLDLAEQLKGE